MNLQNLKLKASTLCAGGTLLVFGGFLTVNLAGCGGGGGGGLTSVATPRPVGATFHIVQQDSAPSNGGTLTLTGNGKTFTGTADNTGVVVLNNVAPGTYTVSFAAVTSNGIVQPTTARKLVITKTGAQNFILVQGDTGNGAFTLTGTIFQNPNNSDISQCTVSSTPVTGQLLVSVRDLNDTTGMPIIAQVVRPLQDAGAPVNLRGRFTISLPTNPRSFRVEVSPADNNGVGFAGISATTTFTQGTTSIDRVNVCANTNGTIPVPFSPTATPTNTPKGGVFPTAASTPTSTATTNPSLTPTGTATSIGTPLPSSTPTTPATVFTPAPGITATPLPGVTNTAFTPLPGITTTPVPNSTTITGAPGLTSIPTGRRTHR